MIDVKSLSKRFEEKEVLNDISTVFEEGKTNLIIGGSGEGKTVLMKCLVGLYETYEGEIYYDARRFKSMTFQEKKNLRKEIGMVFQGGALFDSLTVERNVIFPLTIYTSMTPGEMKKRADFCLDRVNLRDTNHLLPSEISGGMKKRLAIARAIVMKPRYLFCDEPNSGLDPKSAILIDRLIQEIAREYNITTVINTHDMNSVLEIGDKIIFIYQGRKWWEGSRSDILHTGNEEINNFVYASKFLRQTKNP